MLSYYLLLDAILLVSSYEALPASSSPKHTSTKPISLPIRKRAPFFNSQSPAVDIDRNIRLRDRAVERTRLKYRIPDSGGKEESTTLGLLRRRDALQGSVQMGDSEGDIQYFGTINLGSSINNTFEVILDTGSADLLISSVPCTGCPQTTPVYDPSTSSTSVVSSDSFEIAFQSGVAASGYLTSDVMSMAGLVIKNQRFAVCEDLTKITGDTVQGLLGLGWSDLASSNTKPFVEALWSSGQLKSPVFSFAFARWNFATQVEPGGIMTIGGVDDTLYSGSIDYIATPGVASWVIPLDDIFLNGSNLGISTKVANIDTGTSLLGMPLAAVQQIYSRIPDSRPQPDSTSGLWQYPCGTIVSLSLTFGGKIYPISPIDFDAGYASNSSAEKYCIGGVFALDNDVNGNEVWIVGDVFLYHPYNATVKNVYTSFRFEPPSVGFAVLADTGRILEHGLIPVAGSGGTSGSGKDTSAKRSSSASQWGKERGVGLEVAIIVIGVAMALLGI